MIITKDDVRKLGAGRYIGTLPLHCAMLKTAKPLQGRLKEWGRLFTKRVFSGPVSKFTVTHEITY